MTSPQFILSKTKVLEQYHTVNQIADIVSYSSKTNQHVTKILEEKTDSLFSVHFINELKHIKDFSRVIFLAQGWKEKEINDLINKKISWFVVDNESDLDILLNVLENNKISKKINLLLRLKLKENTLRTERYFVFGMRSEIVNKRIKEIKNNEKLKDKINHLGIHFHRKTQNMAEWDYASEIIDVIDNDTLRMIDIINMGGGLPSDYANTNSNVLPTIINKIKEFKKTINNYTINLIIEPGRFIAAPACKLMTTIIGIHENNIIVNASVYNADMDALIVPVKLLVEGELQKDDPDAQPYVIKGSTPCSMDLFRYRVYLKNPKVGDTLTFLNAGAYNFSTDFCDLEKIKTEIRE
jgi:ornithine decarboxylase